MTTTTHYITTIESGFANRPAYTTYGDCWRDEPGGGLHTVWEVNIPAKYTRHYNDRGCVIFETTDGSGYLVVSGGKKGLSYTGPDYRDHELPARCVHIDPITGAPDYEPTNNARTAR